MQHLDVNGTIYINPGDNGTVTLNNVTADNIVVLSGAQNSIHLNNVIANSLTIKDDNTIRIETNGTTAIANTSVQSGAILEATNGSFGAIQLSPTTNAAITLKGDLSASTITIANDNAANSVTIDNSAVVNTINVGSSVNAQTTVINNGTIGSASGITTTGNQPVGSTNSADLLSVKKVENLINELKPAELITSNDETAVNEAKSALGELTNSRQALVSDTLKTKLNLALSKIALIKGAQGVNISLEQLDPIAANFAGQTSLNVSKDIPNGATLEALTLKFANELNMNNEAVNVKLMSAPQGFKYNEGAGETWGQFSKGENNLWSLYVPVGEGNPYSFNTSGPYKLQATFKDSNNLEVTVTINVTVAEPGSYEDLVDLVDQAGKAGEDASGNLLGMNIIFRDRIQAYTATRGSDTVTMATNPVNTITDYDGEGSGVSAYEIFLDLTEFGTAQTEEEYNSTPIHLNVKAGGERYEFNLTTDLLDKIYGDLS